MDSKWTDPGKVLMKKVDIKALGLNNVSASAPSNPEEGEPWYDSTNDEYQLTTGSNWLSTFLGRAVKRTTDKTNGPYLHELIDSKNAISDATATTFMNIGIPNKTLGAMILLEYFVNTDTAKMFRGGQYRIMIGREAGSATEAVMDETISEGQSNTTKAALYSTDATTDAIYQNSGFTSTVANSFSSPSNGCTGVAWDGANILSADTPADFYQHSGFSSTVSASFSSPSTSPVCIAWDGTNLLSTDASSDKIYQHSGFSDTISSSFSSPATDAYGVSWDSLNSDLLSTDFGVGKIYRHSGFSDTISSSFSSPSTMPSDIVLATNDILSISRANDTIYHHSGFSDTIKSSFSSPSIGPYGIDFYSSIASIIRLTIALGATTGAVGATQTIPVQITVEASDQADSNIRYSARILSGGYQDAASGCEVTLTAG